MHRLKKVCQLTRRFTKESWGGIESAVLCLSRELEKSGIQSPVFSTSMLAKKGQEQMNGICIKRFSYCFPWFFLSQEDRCQMDLRGGSPFSFSLLWALLFEPGVSLIHTHVQNRLGGIARTVARIRRIPYVVTVHAGYHTLPEEQAKELMRPFHRKWEWGKFFGWLLGSRRVFLDANAIICVGADEYAQMRQNFPNKPIYLLSNGVDLEYFRNASAKTFRERYGFKESDRLLLCLSRIDSQKNQKDLVEAFAQLDPKKNDLHLVLVGAVTDQTYDKELRELVQQCQCEKVVHFIGNISPDDPLLPSAYKAAEVFVLPSSHEPFGIVILEAWASGTPVIASHVGGIPSFTQTEKNILLFPDRDKKSLLLSLKRVLGEPALKEHLIKGGLEAVKSYNWSEITKQMIAIYKENL